MRNAPSITLYSMYSSNAHRGKPGGSVCTTYNVRQHCHSKQLTVTVQCLWHRHVAVHSIRYKRQCHGTNMWQYTTYNISGSAHGTNMWQYTAYGISGSAHGTHMRQYTAYSISGSALGTNMRQCPWHKHAAVHSIQCKRQCPWHKHAALHSIQYKRQC